MVRVALRVLNGGIATNHWHLDKASRNLQGLLVKSKKSASEEIEDDNRRLASHRP
jgi:hypothetical protein